MGLGLEPLGEGTLYSGKVGNPDRISEDVREKLIMPAAVDSVFDLAFWFCDRALNDNEYLQPSKMQYLLYLSQAYYASAYNGKKLVPAIFVADESGPLEPSVYQAWTQGRPNFEGPNQVPKEVATFGDSIWRRFGHHSSEYLAKLCKKSPPYVTAAQRGRRAEIHIEEMIEAFTRAANSPAVDQVVKPTIKRSHKGRVVQVKSWAPKVVKPPQ